MSRQTACFPSSKALWSAGRWFTPTAGGVMPDWRRPVYQHQVTVLSGGSDRARSHAARPPRRLAAQAMADRYSPGGVQHQHLDYYLDEFNLPLQSPQIK